MRKELNNETLRDFLVAADRVWYNAILQHYKNFHRISDKLIPAEKYIKLFNKMASQFPLHAEALMNLSLNELFWCELRYDENVENERKKTAFLHFFALCRSRNKDHMTHWAMIETLAMFSKGISQSTTRSAAGKNFCTTLAFALSKLEDIY